MIAAGSISAQADVFADGSRIVWLGDSITHECRYTRYLEDFARTRFPHRKLQFFNAGVSGDRVVDALLRFADDVSVWKPTHVFVLFGMNDGGFTSWRDDYFTTFQHNMQVLLDRIEAIDAAAIVLSPTPADTSLSRRLGRDLPPIAKDYDQVLVRYGEWLSDEAGRRRLPFVALHDVLARHDRDLKLANPGASLVPDSIHPNAAGAALVAITILDALLPPEPRFELELSTGSPRTRGCTVRNVEHAGALPRFELESRALPWVLPVEARGAIPLAPSYRERNRATIRIANLPEGAHTLMVDGTALVTRSARQWDKGVDIGLEPAHPDWLLAERMMVVNGQRNALIRDGIRDLWLARRTVREHKENGSPAGQRLQTALHRLRQLEDRLGEIGRKILEADKVLESLARPSFHIYRLEQHDKRGP